MLDPVDTLEAKLAAVTTEHQKVDVLNSLAQKLHETDPKRGLVFAQAAYDLAQTNHYQAGLANSLANLSNLHLVLGNYGLAESLGLQALTLFQELNDRTGQVNVLGYLGRTQLILGNHLEALEHLLHSLQISQELQDRSGETQMLYQIAFGYHLMEDNPRAVETCQKALALDREMGNRRGEARDLNGLAVYLYNLNQHTEALTCAHESIKLAQILDYRLMECHALGTLGEIYEHMGEYAEAIHNSFLAIEMAREMGARFPELTALMMVGSAYHKLQKSDLAIEYYHQALTLAQTLESKKERFNCHRALAELYENQGDLAQALAHYKQFHEVRETVFREDRDRKLQSLEVRHRTETARREAEIYQLKNVALEQEIAERRRAEEALRQYKDHLEEQVAERTAELTTIVAELETRNAELERFTYTVSHDLKSPLITINGFLGMLERDVRLGNATKMREDITHIKSATAKMHQLLSELLELSRIGRMMNPPEAVSLGDLAKEAMNLIQGRITSRPVNVEITPNLPLVYGDRVRLRELLENLIDNAVKYMGQQPHPRIEIGGRYEDDLFVFFVRDNGLGVDPRYHQKIFGLFEKLDQYSEGSGVGLAIVKRIVEVHGGRIWVESPGIGHGSTFCFTLANTNVSSRTPFTPTP